MFVQIDLYFESGCILVEAVNYNHLFSSIIVHFVGDEPDEVRVCGLD